jgi:hypothetical protein
LLPIDQKRRTGFLLQTWRWHESQTKPSSQLNWIWSVTWNPLPRTTTLRGPQDGTRAVICNAGWEIQNELQAKRRMVVNTADIIFENDSLVSLGIYFTQL